MSVEDIAIHGIVFLVFFLNYIPFLKTYLLSLRY